MPAVQAVSAFQDASRRSKSRPGSLQPGGPGTPAGGARGADGFAFGSGQAGMGRTGGVRTGANDR